jgi:hypothetical protein
VVDAGREVLTEYIKYKVVHSNNQKAVAEIQANAQAGFKFNIGYQ